MHKIQILKITSLLLLIVITFTSFFYTNNQIAYANNKIQPDLTLYIHGEKSNGGPIFHTKGNIGNGLWAPGITRSGTIRIYNNYSDRIKVTNLGLKIKLEKLQGEEYTPVEDEKLYELYAKSMKLTIKKGTMLIFTNTIYDKSFFEMLYIKDNKNYQGYDLPLKNKFNIRKNKYIDLEYTVHMDENAGNELQGLKATVAFIINSHENPEYQKPDNNKKDKAIDTDGHWAHDCIETLLEHGIIQGYPDGTIRPENYITRAETAILIAKAIGLEEKEGFTGYIDPIPAWVKGYIKAGTENGFIEGYPNKMFKPNNNITREEMITAAMRAFNKKIDEEFDINFTDKNAIQNWAFEYVRAGVYMNIIEGYPDGTFKPGNNITRAEAFTIICKLLGYHEEHKN